MPGITTLVKIGLAGCKDMDSLQVHYTTSVFSYSFVICVSRRSEDVERNNLAFNEFDRRWTKIETKLIF